MTKQMTNFKIGDIVEDKTIGKRSGYGTVIDIQNGEVKVLWETQGIAWYAQASLRTIQLVLDIETELSFYKIGKSKDGSYYILNKDGSFYTNQAYATYEDAASMLENVIGQDCGDYYGDY